MAKRDMEIERYIEREKERDNTYIILTKLWHDLII